MFSRRKPPTARVTKKPLFRFDSSRHALSINSYMREQRDLELTGGSEPVAAHHYEQDQPSIAQHLVCKPHNRNITGTAGEGRGTEHWANLFCAVTLQLSSGS